MEPEWLRWVRQMQAIAQSGLAFSPNVYDLERYEQLRHLAAEILTAYTNVPIEHIHGLFEQQTGYATPKVDVRGVVFKGDAMLLVREKADEGRWTLPGGWADVNDMPSAAVEREIHEESGYRTRTTKVLAVYDRTKQGHSPYPFHVYKLFFQCELLSDQPDIAETEHETGEPTFFLETELPNDLSLGRVTAAQLARFFEHHRQPSLPTDFD
jgi:ADP-ribose pyrophosphatase YjhB (NUDIX family)